MRNKNILIIKTLILGFILSCNALNAHSFTTINPFVNTLEESSIRVEYLEANTLNGKFIELTKQNVSETAQTRTTYYANNTYKVIINEIFRDNFIEVNGELEHLIKGNSCVTLRVIFPLNGNTWKWYQGFENELNMENDSVYSDLKAISTVLPPDGAFNTQNSSNGGYGDAVGQGEMSFYPLAAINVDNKGEGLGVDMELPLVYRLSAKANQGLIAEFDMATSAFTDKFTNRAFFKLSRFKFNSEWGMRAALKKYYSFYPEAFKKRVTTEGVWLPFTPLRSIKNWEDFGFAYHELSWNSFDKKGEESLPTITSDKGTGVLSFQYTEPWDVQLPILTKEIDYDTLISNKMVPKAHQEYLENSATYDKNGLLQTRRLKTPWFSSGWAVSITTNSDPDLRGTNRYHYVRETEITPAIKMNVDGVYFDSMEWNWHHDLNYRESHFKYTDYPLSFSKDVNKPAIWHFTSEFEMMKNIADEMHAQGKLVMGNGHTWNPFAASNLDLFGAELSWYSTGDHGTDALDFKRAISFQKPIVFLLNEGLNDKAFTDYPYVGYEIYFEKLLTYGFFPSFFSTDASSDPYWMDAEKIENGRPFFKKYIPIIKQISGAGWEPVTYAVSNSDAVRLERFGIGENLYFTVRNNGSATAECEIELSLSDLKLSEKFIALELVSDNNLKVKKNKISVVIPAGRTQVIKIN
jgi:hypothetical protein